MMKFIKNLAIISSLIVVVIVGFLIYNARKGIKDFQQISFEELPANVQLAYQERKDSLMEDNIFYCTSINNDCNCKIEARNALPLAKSWIYIYLCDQKFIIDFSLTSLRLFVITEKDLYFPIVTSVNYNSRTKISDIIGINKIKYGRINLVQ